MSKGSLFFCCFFLHHEALSSDAKHRTKGQFFLSFPQAHVGFFSCKPLSASAEMNSVLL